MELRDLTDHGESERERRTADPAYAAEQDRLASADAVSVALVRYRAAGGLSQSNLAVMLGWSLSDVAGLERGDQPLDAEAATAVASALGITIEGVPPRRP